MASYATSVLALQTQTNALVTALTNGHTVSSGDVTALGALKTAVDALVPQTTHLTGEAGEIQDFATRGNKAIPL